MPSEVSHSVSGLARATCVVLFVVSLVEVLCGFVLGWLVAGIVGFADASDGPVRMLSNVTTARIMFCNPLTVAGVLGLGCSATAVGRLPPPWALLVAAFVQSALAVGVLSAALFNESIMFTLFVVGNFVVLAGLSTACIVAARKLRINAVV